MINFSSLVADCLISEAAPSPSPFSVYYEDSAELTELRSYFESTFSIGSSWPRASAMFPVLQDAFVRPRAVALKPFAEKFPLIDFVWFVVERLSENTDVLALSGAGSTIDIQAPEINKMSDSFKTSCASNNPGTNIHPLFGYTPVSAKATSYIRPLQKQIANNLVGGLNLQQFDGESLRKALYGILEIRRKVRASVLQTKNIPNSLKWIDGILENPGQYAGQIQIPSEIKVLYDKVTGDQLVHLAETFHNFYNSETAAALETLPVVGGKKSTETITTPFMAFAANEGKLDSNGYAFVTSSGNECFSPSLSGTSGASSGYIISNIKKINTPQAKEVITELTSLANHVSEGEPTDVAGTLRGLSRIAKGLSLGVPTMGSR